MNIAFDAKRAFNNRTGLGNYSRSLIEALHQYYPAHRYILYTPLLKRPSLFDQARDMAGVLVVESPNKVGAALWRSWGIPRHLSAQGVQLYHGLSAELPAGQAPPGVQYVVTIHDLIFMRFPDLYSAVDRRIYTYKTRKACAKAARVIAISEQTKQDLIYMLQVPEAKIRVIYQTCDPVFEQRLSAERLQEVAVRYQLPARFLLSVGTIEARKNVLLIAKALQYLPESVHLVLVGRKTAYADEVTAFLNKHGLAHRVLFLSDLGFEDLPAVYQLADIFIYPSRFEGFGIPVIEALKSGVPVIAAKGSCLEEAGGPDSRYVHPDDEQELAQHITELWTNEALRQAQIAQGAVYGRRFSTAQFAADTMQLYQELV